MTYSISISHHSSFNRIYRVYLLKFVLQASTEDVDNENGMELTRDVWIDDIHKNSCDWLHGWVGGLYKRDEQWYQWSLIIDKHNIYHPCRTIQIHFTYIKNVPRDPQSMICSMQTLCFSPIRLLSSILSTIKSTAFTNTCVTWREASLTWNCGLNTSCHVHLDDGLDISLFYDLCHHVLFLRDTMATTHILWHRSFASSLGTHQSEYKECVSSSIKSWSVLPSTNTDNWLHLLLDHDPC